MVALCCIEKAYAQIAPDPDVVADIHACREITGPMERLACYDQAVGLLQSAQESGEVVTISKTRVEEIRKDSFGLTIPSLPEPGRLSGNTSETGETVTIDHGAKATVERRVPQTENMNEIELLIGKTGTFGYNKTRFFFTNGQVWEQVDSTRVRIPKVRNNKLNTGVIQKAAMGSYLMRINGSGRAVRVRRVR